MPGTINSPLDTDVFIDLWDRVRADESWPDLNQKALSKFTFGGGKLTGLPMGLICESLIYNKKLGDSLGITFDYKTLTWNGMMDIARSADLSNAYLYGYYSKEADTLYIQTALQNFRELINVESKTADMKQHWFIDLMRKVKETEDGGYTKYIGDDSQQPEDCLFTYKSIYSLISHENYLERIGDDFISIPMPRGEQKRNNIAHAMYVMCISARSKYPGEAWKFISYFLKDSTQTLLDAIPLNKKTLDQAFDIFWNDQPEEAVERQKRIVDTIDIMGASRYQRTLFENLDEYMYGDKKLEDALEKAEYDIWLLLNE
jgi:ABC-type glycerol-3-phosphate transport system substrate-binding protein